MLIELEGSPGLITESDIALLEDALLLAYNSVAECDLPGLFIQAKNVTIQVDAVDSFGDNISTGNDAVLAFTWLVLFQGECRGCPVSTRTVFEGEDENAPQCSCSLPSASAYAMECNDIIQERIPTFSAARVRFATSIFSSGSSTTGPGPVGPFSSFVTISASGGVDGSSSLTPFELEQIGQAFVESYNALNFLNPATCDAESRIVTSVVPSSLTSNGRRQLQDDAPSLFSIVFEIQGTCSDCSSVTI